MTVFEGKLVSENIKIGIVASRFNEFITSKLIGGAIDGLVRHNVREQDVDIAWVPGAFEAPLAAQKMAQTGRYDAVICLGAVIRGATSHYDLVCSEAAKGIAHVSLESGVPVMFGIVTTDTIEQAIERASFSSRLCRLGGRGMGQAASVLRRGDRLMARLFPRLHVGRLHARPPRSGVAIRFGRRRRRIAPLARRGRGMLVLRGDNRVEIAA